MVDALRKTSSWMSDGLEQKVANWLAHPWLLARKGFHIIENIYYVGNQWVSCYLIKTQKGLVLIDCAMQETLYQLVDEIHQLGFDPHEIKYLLLSHGHFDHVGAARAVQEMSGCETWLGQEDAFFYTERRDLIGFEKQVPNFKIDHFYDYDDTLDFGDVVIKPVHCPGHTSGTTSFFFDILHEDRKLTCAMHGGLGAASLTRRALADAGRPISVQKIYLESLDKIIDCKVDVVLPSHAKHAKDHDIFQIAAEDSGDGSGFIDSGAWKRMISGKQQEMRQIMSDFHSPSVSKIT